MHGTKRERNCPLRYVEACPRIEGTKFKMLKHSSKDILNEIKKTFGMPFNYFYTVSL